MRLWLKTAIDKTVQECIEEGILGDFLLAHRAEVFDVCLTEYDEEIVKRDLREEGREEVIYAFIESFQELGIPQDIILEKLTQKFGITNDKANEYIAKSSKL